MVEEFRAESRRAGIRGMRDTEGKLTDAYGAPKIADACCDIGRHVDVYRIEIDVEVMHGGAQCGQTLAGVIDPACIVYQSAAPCR